MNVQEAAEAPNINSFQMRSSFHPHDAQPGRLLLAEATPPWVRAELQRMGYRLEFQRLTSGPINAIFFDRNTARCGRLEQPRRGLRHRLVAGRIGFTTPGRRTPGPDAPGSGAQGRAARVVGVTRRAAARPARRAGSAPASHATRPPSSPGREHDWRPERDGGLARGIDGQRQQARQAEQRLADARRSAKATAMPA